MESAFTILVLEDEPKTAARLTEIVRRFGEPAVVNSIAAARAALGNDVVWGAFLLDVKLADGSGIDVLREARKQYPNVAAAFVSGWAFVDIIDAANRLDAYYILKNAEQNDFLERFLRLAKEHALATPDRLEAKAAEWCERFFRRAPALADVLYGTVVDGETREQVAERRNVDVMTVRDQEEAIAAKTGHRTFDDAVMSLLREAARAKRPIRGRR
jgi:DNA-binding NarL/FixJ family response regulator